MEQKAKFIIMGLIGIFLISIFISIRIYGAKKVVERERDEVKKENVSLGKKLEVSLQEKKRLEDRVATLGKDIERIGKEKEEVQKKFDWLEKEREKLVEELKSLKVKPALPQAGQALPQSAEAYWGGILKAKTDLELQIENVRNELRNVQINNEQLKREKVTLDLDINNLNREKQDLNRQVEYNKKVLDSISAELVREKNDKLMLQETLRPIRNENNILRRQLGSLNSRKITLERKFQKLQEEKSSLERKLTEMETILRDQVVNIGNLRQQLDTVRSSRVETSLEEDAVILPPIVVHPQTETEAPSYLEPEAPSVKGKVLAVNKENNFVIIDLGENAGLKLGDLLHVEREGKVIATIKAIRTRRSITACDIEKEIAPIRVGDTIK